MGVYEICVWAGFRLTLDYREVFNCEKIISFEGESLRMLKIAFQGYFPYDPEKKKMEVTGAHFLRLLAEQSLKYMQRSPALLVLNVKAVDMSNVTLVSLTSCKRQFLSESTEHDLRKRLQLRIRRSHQASRPIYFG